MLADFFENNLFHFVSKLKYNFDIKLIAIDLLTNQNFSKKFRYPKLPLNTKKILEKKE